jgi:hypothetical protein
MFKQTFSALFLCVCFGAFSCTDKSSGFFGDDVTPPGNGAGDNGNTGGDAIGGQDLFGGGTPTIDADASLDTVNPNGDPDNPPEPVPEPMTMLLFGSGLASVAYRYRRRKEGKEEGEAVNV